MDESRGDVFDKQAKWCVCRVPYQYIGLYGKITEYLLYYVLKDKYLSLHNNNPLEFEGNICY